MFVFPCYPKNPKKIKKQRQQSGIVGISSECKRHAFQPFVPLSVRDTHRKTILGEKMLQTKMEMKTQCFHKFLIFKIV